MTLLFALAVAILFGTGAFLLLKNDLLRVVAGVIMISNAAALFIMATGLFRGVAPIYPLAENAVVSDPLVQAMVLTAIVISFGVTALLLSLVYRVYMVHQSIDDGTDTEEAGLLQQTLQDTQEHEVERKQELVSC
jgi:multicomponent Na+:H+ antiporter subunit C